MTALHAATIDTLKVWLDEGGSEYYLCQQCEGLHLRALEDHEGVIDSRLFLEGYGLLLTTELELRPAALLHVSADLARLNTDYPTLKVFVDVVDDAVPQLVVAANLCMGSDLTRDQFAHFFSVAVEATAHLASACRQLDYLYSEAAPESSVLH